MADVSYTPTFHHRPWRDRRDRVEAGGLNGFNARFAAIESDLHQVSTVVDQIGAEIDRINAIANPPPRERRLTFTPTFQDVRGAPTFQGWDVDTEGFPVSGGFGHQLAVRGLVNLDLPHGAQFSALKVSYEIGGDPTIALTISVRRTPLRPTPPPVVTEELAGVELTLHSRLGAFVLDLPVRTPALAKVDLDAFRYFVMFEGGAPVNAGSPTISVKSFELRYTA